MIKNNRRLKLKYNIMIKYVFGLKLMMLSLKLKFAKTISIHNLIYVGIFDSKLLLVK